MQRTEPGDDEALLAVLTALANPHRLRIIAALHGGSTYVSQLARDLGLGRPLLHMHLQKLVDAGLVVSETTVAADGKAHRYLTVPDWRWIVDPALIARSVARHQERSAAHTKGDDDG